MSLQYFGEQFAGKTLRKFYQTAVTPSITNSNYEGEIKKAGDRVNILSFLGDVALNDYVAGTDMSTDTIVDNEDQLVVEKRKYYNFPIDRLENLFTYAGDVSDTLVENANKILERSIDTYVLEFVQYAKAGSWVGQNLKVVGSSRDTEASITTSATGGILVVQAGGTGATGTNSVVATENPNDGGTYSTGFYAEDIGRPIRLTSGATWATAWYRISSITDTVTVTITNWDGAIAGGDIPNGDILRGLYGASGGWEFGGMPQNGDGKPTTQGGWGWELQGVIATTLSSSTMYNAITELASRLNENEIPDTDRHITYPTNHYQTLLQASQLQPSGVAEIYSGTVLNARVMRIGGFDVHVAAGSRVTTRAEKAGGSGLGADHTVTTGTQRSQVLANHTSFITFAYKWAESRVVDAENQFAKKYQGLHLWGATVPAMRRKAGALLYITSS